MAFLGRLLLIAFLALALGGCWGDDEPVAGSPSAANAPRKKKAATKKIVAKQVEVAEPEFQYDPKGLRDPFMPFIKLAKDQPVQAGVNKATVTNFIPKTPLQRYATEELTLVGIVWRKDGKATALVQDPQGKGYVVRKGTFVGDRGGKIARISPDKLVIEERFVDILGEQTVRAIDMRLHRSEDEVGR